MDAPNASNTTGHVPQRWNTMEYTGFLGGESHQGESMLSFCSLNLPSALPSTSSADTAQPAILMLTIPLHPPPPLDWCGAAAFLEFKTSALNRASKSSLPPAMWTLSTRALTMLEPPIKREPVTLKRTGAWVNCAQPSAWDKGIHVNIHTTYTVCTCKTLGSMIRRRRVYVVRPGEDRQGR